MIRIRVHHTLGNSHIHVEGQVAGDFVEELSRCWLSTLTPDNHIIVDISDVVHVDQRGRQLLGQMYASHVEFIGARLALQDVLNEIKTKQLFKGGN